MTPPKRTRSGALFVELEACSGTQSPLPGPSGQPLSPVSVFAPPPQHSRNRRLGAALCHATVRRRTPLRRTHCTQWGPTLRVFTILIPHRAPVVCRTPGLPLVRVAHPHHFDTALPSTVVQCAHSPP